MKKVLLSDAMLFGIASTCLSIMIMLFFVAYNIVDVSTTMFLLPASTFCLVFCTVYYKRKMKSFDDTAYFVKRSSVSHISQRLNHPSNNTAKSTIPMPRVYEPSTLADIVDAEIIEDIHNYSDSKKIPAVLDIHIVGSHIANYKS